MIHTARRIIPGTPEADAIAEELGVPWSPDARTEPVDHDELRRKAERRLRVGYPVRERLDDESRRWGK